VHAVNQNVAWVSGVDGTFAVTTDGDATWRPASCPVPKRWSSATSRE
jgi:hypothetical protein